MPDCTNVGPELQTFCLDQEIESLANINHKVETLWKKGSRLKHILHNLKIFVCLLNALIPLLKGPLSFYKLLNKIRKHQEVNLKTKFLKKIESLLVKKNVRESYLLTKNTEMIQVNFANLDSQPIINLEIKNIPFSSTLNTGSSLTIIPAKHFQQLNKQIEYRKKL